MKTECSVNRLAFQPLGQREVVGDFNGGTITSDAGGVLLREIEDRLDIIDQFAGCFLDYRDQRWVEHSVKELVGQRVFGLSLGYEDLIDHEDLRYDPLLAVLVGKSDPTGQSRFLRRDRGKPLAGKSTLNRLELAPANTSPKSRYKKIVARSEEIERLFVELFLQAHAAPPKRIVLDLDATDDPLHGNQEGCFFHGYYKAYCYLPLYIFCGEFLLCAKLRPSNIDASAGTVEQLEPIVSRIREIWPEVEIVIRADSGFAREEIMAWCEQNKVDFLLGLAKNSRLKEVLAPELAQAKKQHEETGQPARVFKDFTYQTLDSWSRPRRVVGKAEHLAKGANPRFVVASISADRIDARTLYEQDYCGRGDMENRIKEQQLYLFADRTSTATISANQLRLWFSSMAYVLMQSLRRLGLQGTNLAKAQCHTIRLKLLKIGAQIRVTVRKVWLALASGYPYEPLFRQVHENLMRLPPRPKPG